MKKTKTIAVVYGHGIFSDRRQNFVFENRVISWGCLSKVHSLKQREEKPVFVDQENVGTICCGFDATGDYLENNSFSKEILKLAYINRKARDLPGILADLLTYFLPSGKENNKCVFITDKNFTVEVLFDLKEKTFQIKTYPPGVMRIYVGAENSGFINKVNDIFSDKVVTEEFARSAFLAVSGRYQGSINYDHSTSDFAFKKDIRPSLEEEKQAIANFFHPRYTYHEPSKRYYD